MLKVILLGSKNTIVSQKQGISPPVDTPMAPIRTLGSAMMTHKIDATIDTICALLGVLWDRTLVK